MRVPSIGLTPDERRIVEEGYRLAEYLLRDYQDPPSLMDNLVNWFRTLRLVRH